MTAPRKAGLIFTLIALISDQASKLWLIDLLATRGQAIEITPFFNLVMVWNTGVSFGLFSRSAAAWVLIALALAIVIALLVWLWRANGLGQGIGLGLVIGGALGNMIDRLRFGAVADFFDFFIGNWHWPAFNIADSAIMIGALLLIVDGLTDSAREAYVRSKDP